MKIEALTADHVTYLCELLPIEMDSDLNRIWKIEKQQPRNDAEFYNAKILSYQWYYFNKFHCEYSSAIQRKIELLDV